MANSITKLKKPQSDGGYQVDFLGSTFKIKFPEFNERQKNDIVKFANGKSKIDYIHYSAVLSRSRRVAFFAAANIDGTVWKDNPRKGDWQDDPRITAEDQLGQKLYDAKKSEFDRGHLVRREDPEWGDAKLSVEAGKNTFWFPNCAPQHKDLNQRIWAELEANILHKGADKNNLKVIVFSGPVLADTDGVFVTKVEGKDIQIPNLFWKVVVWTKSNGKAHAVGFLMSQEKFLIRDGIIKKQLIANAKRLRKLTDEDIFEHLTFKDGKTYQVRIEEIEKLTGLKFDWHGVIRPFKKVAPSEIRGRAIPKAKLRTRGGIKASTAGDIVGIKMNMNLSGLTI
jgi:endonuclease G